MNPYILVLCAAINFGVWTHAIWGGVFMFCLLLLIDFWVDN